MAEPVTAALAASAAASSVAASTASVGFIASVAMFITGIVAAWGIIILSALVILGILFEHNGARGWSVFSALLVAATAYLFFNVSLLMIAVGAVAYIAIGLVWSFYRYKRHASDVVEANKNESANVKERALRDLHPKAMLPTITAWITIWPFSLVENFVGDIINFIQDLVQKVFRGIYHKIYDSAVAALK